MYIVVKNIVGSNRIDGKMLGMQVFDTWESKPYKTKAGAIKAANKISGNVGVRRISGPLVWSKGTMYDTKAK